MRIISGEFKGREINFLKNTNTRPLKDAVKENIFNILKHSNKIKIKIENSNILDLYSGIGSFGIECISRGAGKVTFVEKEENAVKLLKDRCADVILINCSRPETVSIALPILKNSGIVFGAYANGFSSVEKLEPGKNVNVLESRKDLDPAEYSKFAIDWAENGATFLGGCCEITPNHIQYLSKELVKNGYRISNYDL